MFRKKGEGNARKCMAGIAGGWLYIDVKRKTSWNSSLVSLPQEMVVESKEGELQLKLFMAERNCSKIATALGILFRVVLKKLKLYKI